jgi:hypothetical protein
MHSLQLSDMRYGQRGNLNLCVSLNKTKKPRLDHDDLDEETTGFLHLFHRGMKAKCVEAYILYNVLRGLMSNM